MKQKKVYLVLICSLIFVTLFVQESHALVAQLNTLRDRLNDLQMVLLGKKPALPEKPKENGDGEREPSELQKQKNILDKFIKLSKSGEEVNIDSYKEALTEYKKLNPSKEQVQFYDFWRYRLELDSYLDLYPVYKLGLDTDQDALSALLKESSELFKKYKELRKSIEIPKDEKLREAAKLVVYDNWINRLQTRLDAVKQSLQNQRKLLEKQLEEQEEKVHTAATMREWIDFFEEYEDIASDEAKVNLFSFKLVQAFSTFFIDTWNRLGGLKNRQKIVEEMQGLSYEKIDLTDLLVTFNEVLEGFKDTMPDTQEARTQYKKLNEWYEKLITELTVLVSEAVKAAKDKKPSESPLTPSESKKIEKPEFYFPKPVPFIELGMDPTGNRIYIQIGLVEVGKTETNESIFQLILWGPYLREDTTPKDFFEEGKFIYPFNRIRGIQVDFQQDPMRIKGELPPYAAFVLYDGMIPAKIRKEQEQLKTNRMNDLKQLEEKVEKIKQISEKQIEEVKKKKLESMNLGEIKKISPAIQNILQDVVSPFTQFIDEALSNETKPLYIKNIFDENVLKEIQDIIIPYSEQLRMLVEHCEKIRKFVIQQITNIISKTEGVLPGEMPGIAGPWAKEKKELSKSCVMPLEVVLESLASLNKEIEYQTVKAKEVLGYGPAYELFNAFIKAYQEDKKTYKPDIILRPSQVREKIESEQKELEKIIAQLPLQLEEELTEKQEEIYKELRSEYKHLREAYLENKKNFLDNWQKKLAPEQSIILERLNQLVKFAKIKEDPPVDSIKKFILTLQLLK